MPLKLYYLQTSTEAVLVLAHDPNECNRIAVQDTGDFQWATTKVEKRVLLAEQVSPAIDRGQARVLLHAHAAEDRFAMN